MTQHARLSASSSNIWLTCTKAGELFGSAIAAPNKSNVFADEGTAAHSLAEDCLTTNRDPDAFLGLEIKGGEHSFTVDREMVEAVSVYTNHVRELLAQNPEWAVFEQQVSLGKLWTDGVGPEPLFGTGDFICQIGGVIHVVDLKYGRNILVEIDGNTQTQFYGLGASLLPGIKSYDTAELTIVQPRAYHEDGPIRSKTLTNLDLAMFGRELKLKVEEIRSGDGTFVTGDHCRFCPISGACPALRADALSVAQAQFDDQTQSLTTPDISDISREDALAMLPHVDKVRAWAKSVEEFALNEARRGRGPEGYKLVETESRTKWLKEPSFQKVYLDLPNMQTADIVEAMYKLKTPKQAAQGLTSNTGFSRVEDALAAFGDQVGKEKTGVKLVPETDKRPAINAVDKFENAQDTSAVIDSYFVAFATGSDNNQSQQKRI